MSFQYATYDDYMVKLDLTTAEISIRCGQVVLAEKLTFYKNGKKLCFTEADTDWLLTSNDLVAKYYEEDESRVLRLSVHQDGVTIKAIECLQMKGVCSFGADARPMSLEKHNFFRSAYGPAATTLDDMLFDMEKDAAFIMKGDCGKRFRFNHEEQVFEIDARINGEVSLFYEEEIYKRKYKINYKPISKDVTFKKPPVGWMTWYALTFDANEKTVMANVTWLEEHLNRYGVDTIWIDWEWYHDAGFDTFHPDTTRYPKGMKQLSDDIRKHGLSPSLWVAFAREWEVNDYMREHPEIMLAIDQFWCGKYFFDYSNPTYLEDFLPKALRQVDEWGFEAVKFDTLAPGIRAQERFHQHMYNPEMTSKEAYRKVAEVTREVLGKDRYLLSCCAANDSDILWACDKFEAARVGADVFQWGEFIESAVKRVARYYPFHNVVFYNDADCVIAREEYSTIEQVKSRTAFISMLGLPVTLGDDMPTLSQDRVEIIKRSIPVLDIHTTDLNRTEFADVTITNLTVDTKLQRYNLVNVFNTTEEVVTETVCLDALGIDAKDLVYYEYYSGETQDVANGTITASLKPFETKIYAIREKTVHPQIISTNRHVTQGAIEIVALAWNDKARTLSFKADLVGEDLYTVSVRVPEGYTFAKQNGFDTAVCEDNILKLSVTVPENETRSFEVIFN